jgi:hypothetical protein
MLNLPAYAIFMKKGALGILGCLIQYVVLSQGDIPFNSREVILDPTLPDSGISFRFEGTDPDFPTFFVDDLDGVIFFPGSGNAGGGSSYSTGSGSATLSPPNSPSDVRSRGFSGSGYFNSGDQMEDGAFALQLGNGVNPLIDGSGKMQIAPELKSDDGDEPLLIQRGVIKDDGAFELSVKGSPHLSFNVQVSLDGKKFTDLAQAGIVFHTCDDKGQCTVIDQQANQSAFRFYRLQVFDQPITAAEN